MHATTLSGWLRPLGVGLALGGLAWLIFGRRPAGKPVQWMAGSKAEAMERWADDGGSVPEVPLEPWEREADRARAAARALQHRIAQARRGGTLSESAGALHSADVLEALAADVRRAMNAGLEGMSQAARDTTLAAREAAYVARLTASRASTAAIGTRPFLSAGALALAGAAAAWLLPQSQTEARLLRGTARRVADLGLTIVEVEAQRLAAGLVEVLGSDLRQKAATG